VPRREEVGLCRVWKIGERSEERRVGRLEGRAGGVKGMAPAGGGGGEGRGRAGGKGRERAVKGRRYHEIAAVKRNDSRFDSIESGAMSSIDWKFGLFYQKKRFSSDTSVTISRKPRICTFPCVPSSDFGFAGVRPGS